MTRLSPAAASFDFDLHSTHHTRPVHATARPAAGDVSVLVPLLHPDTRIRTHSGVRWHSPLSPLLHSYASSPSRNARSAAAQQQQLHVLLLVMEELSGAMNGTADILYGRCVCTAVHRGSDAT